METTWRCNTKTGIMNTYTQNASAMTVSMATIWTPSMHACRAQKKSPSTREPEPTESERTCQHTTQDEGTAKRIHCRTNNALNTETYHKHGEKRQEKDGEKHQRDAHTRTSIITRSLLIRGTEEKRVHRVGHKRRKDWGAKPRYAAPQNHKV